jgi:hypothetical protein
MNKQIQVQKQHEYVEEEEDVDEHQREKIKKWKELLRKLGLIQTVAYHCNRCNHLWFPKDFDAILASATSGGLNLIRETAPKACARCKSRYWNSPPKRKTRSSSIETTDFSAHKLRSYMGSDKMDFFGHDMLTGKRVLADIRRTKKRMAEDDTEIARLKKYAKKRALNI